ncbi:hypothetical protein [Geobacillus thermoleovorans]|nr:hypothetical protein [Geobacillus thermoleovorans]
MKLDGIWMESIELDKIVPIYVENVSKRAVEKMVKILEGRGSVKQPCYC